MLAFTATYKLSNDNGSTTYISKPFKTKEEAKKELFEELERLEKDGELNNMTYCNVIAETVPTLPTKFPEPLQAFLKKMFKGETLQVKQEEEAISTASKPKKINIKKINKRLKKLELKRRKIDAKIEATKDLIMPLRKDKPCHIKTSLYGTLNPSEHSVLVNKSYDFYKHLMKIDQLNPLSLKAYLEVIKKLKKEDKLFSSITFKQSSTSVFF